MSIFSDYSTFKYIYPPRPESALKPSLLDTMSDQWIAQPKYNGSCAVLFINGKKNSKIYNRHGENLTLQQPLNYQALNDTDKYMVLCGEYLNKNKNGEAGTPFNHKFVIWDILVNDGLYLIGKTVEDRLLLMYNLFGTNRGNVNKTTFSIYNHLFITTVEGVFVAPSYMSNFKKLYDEITQTDLYEGLVLKKKTAKLEPAFREKNNTSWQVKARKEISNYKF